MLSMHFMCKYNLRFENQNTVTGCHLNNSTDLIFLHKISYNSS